MTIADETVTTKVGTLHVEVDGEGPPTVLWHSLFVDSTTWHRLRPLLRTDRRLILIDGPGHGRSSAAPGFRLDECPAAALQVLDAIGVQGPVDWVGNAWGGHVGLILAAQAPTRLRSLVTIATPPHAITAGERAGIVPVVWAYRVLAPTVYPRLKELIQLVAAGGLIQIPSSAKDFHNPELRPFQVKTVLATLFAAAAAVGCSRLILGNHPDFQVDPIGAPDLAWLPLFVVFGLLTGCLGAVYNGLVLWFLDHVAALRRIPTVAKASMIGAIVGLAMFIYPLAVGGGDPLTQRILGGHHIVLSVVIGYLAVRFIAGPLSYSAAVPGGLFAPLLAVGALWGILFVGGFNAVWPGNATSLAVPMALVGMATFFAATVRAPVTGMVLVVEMTATTEVLVPMMAAIAAAVLAAYVVRSPPIYDSLRERMPDEASIRRRGGS